MLLQESKGQNSWLQIIRCRLEYTEKVQSVDHVVVFRLQIVLLGLPDRDLNFFLIETLVKKIVVSKPLKKSLAINSTLNVEAYYKQKDQMIH